jgi:hypothetical protein
MSDNKMAQDQNVEAHHKLGQQLALNLIKAQSGYGSPVPLVAAVGLLLAFIPRNAMPEGQEAFQAMINLTLQQAKAPWRLVATPGDAGAASAPVAATEPDQFAN